MAKKLLRYIVFMLRIRRVEFRIAEIPILGIPVLLLCRDTAILRTLDFWEGVFIFFLLFAFGDMINCLADRDLDAIYKPHLSESVYGLGVPFVKLQIWLTALLVVVLSIHLSWRIDRWPIAALTVTGLLLGAAYSVEPVRLKGRGLLQLVCLWTIIFFGPMLFVIQLVQASLSAGVIIFAAVYGALQMGIILINTAEDYPEDMASGVTTSIVSMGLKKGILLAVWLTTGGAAGTLFVLLHFYSPLRDVQAWAVGLLPVAAGYIFVVMSVANLYRKIRNAELADAIQAVKTAGRYVPVWVTAAAWSTFWATGVLFYYK